MSTQARLEAEIYELKERQRQLPVERALATLVGMEAAISVLHRHNLLIEWGAEVERLNTAIKAEPTDTGSAT